MKKKITKCYNMEINHLILFGQNIGIFGLIVLAYSTPRIGLVGEASGRCHISGHSDKMFLFLSSFFYGNLNHNHEKD